jgi:actin related protein 2/3 complex subunit 4
LLIVS